MTYPTEIEIGYEAIINFIVQVVDESSILLTDGSSISGLLSEQVIRDLRVQKAFVSACGYSVEHGLTEACLEEAQFKTESDQVCETCLSIG